MNEIEHKLLAAREAHENGDYDLAFMIGNELASIGDASAQYNIAGYFENGFSVKKDREIAIKFFKQSAENGFVPAIEKLRIIELNFESYMKS